MWEFDADPSLAPRLPAGLLKTPAGRYVLLTATPGEPEDGDLVMFVEVVLSLGRLAIFLPSLIMDTRFITGLSPTDPADIA